MMNQTRLESNVTKAKAAAEEVAIRLHNLEAADPRLRLRNWKTYRVELMRDFILYTHLAIEHLLRDLLVYRLKEEPRITTVKRPKATVGEMRSREVVDWCGRLGVLTKRQFANVAALNRIRNKCVHNWMIDEPEIRRDSKGKRIRKIVVEFRGRDIFAKENFFEDFWPT